MRLPPAGRGVSTIGSTRVVLARPLTLALVLAARASWAGGTPLAVPLAVEETAGVARRAWPASASVPLPRGRVRRAEALWLAASDGRAVPLQTRVLERWPDGSARWLLLDFPADVEAGKLARYTLRDGAVPAAAAGARVRVESGGDGARVIDTGALRVTVPARGGALLAEVAAGATRLAGPVELPALGVDGAPGGQPTYERPSVETEGPVRSELLVAGRYPGGIAWEARIAAFAGQRFLRLQLTLTNLGEPHYAAVNSLLLAVPGRFTSAAFGVDGVPRPLASLEPPHELVQADATPALLDGARAGKHADGWATARGDGGAVTIVAPWFWEEYPKAFRVGVHHLAIDLFAGREAPLQFGTGAAKTHELWLALEPADGGASPAELAAALGAPLVALPPAAWIVESRALPNALDPDAPGARDFLARLATAHAGYRRNVERERWDDGLPVPCEERTEEHPRVGLYGVFNWGDWQFPGYRDHTRGCDGWGNLEYDLPQVLALAWAATGSRGFWDGLGPAARHYRDVDIIHHAPGHPEWVGMNHPHKALHFAFESPETIDLGHTWTEGLVSYHRLTGDVRALAAARGIADALTAKVARARNPRQFGWPMLALVAVYDATGERRYLDAARAYADAGTRRFHPTPASGDWKMGILADGVAAVDRAGGDARFRRWLVAYADALVGSSGRFADPRYALPLGQLYAETGDARYERVALATVRDMKIGEWGKPLAANGRTGFRILAPLAERAGLRPSPSPPPPPSRSKPEVKRGRDAPRPESGSVRRRRSRSR